MSFFSAVFYALTFPGAMVREAAHLFFCRVFRLAVFEVRFLQTEPPYGFVRHEHSRHLGVALVETLGPMAVNLALCLLFCSSAFLPVWELRIFDPVAYLFYWLGLAMGLQAFPAADDVRHLRGLALAGMKRGNPVALLAAPLLALVFLIHAARALWTDRFFGLAAGVFVPLALFRLLL
jgi:hypothetical protein